MFLLELAGSYSGTKHLILSPAEPPRPSPATATVTPVSRGKLVRLDYTWDDNGRVDGKGDLAAETHFHPATIKNE